MQSSFPLVVPLLLLLICWATTTTTVTGFSVVSSISARSTLTYTTASTTASRSSRIRSKILPVLRVLLNDDDADESESIGESTSAESAELISLGWKPHFHSQLIHKTKESIENQTNITYIPARITQILSHKLVVRGTAGLIKTITRSSTTRDVDVAVGDWVLLDQQYPDRILVVLERVSLLQRLAPGRSSRKIQLLAANLDTVFVVSSCNQDFNAARLERYIAMVLNNDVDADVENKQGTHAHAHIVPIQPVIVLTKRDLWDDIDTDIDIDMDDNDDMDDDDDFDGAAALDMYVKQAESIAITDTITTKQKKIPVVVLDARYEEPLQQLAEWCQPGQTVAFVGSSGVGKSTLVNSLMGKKIAETGDIHLDSGQGRHTTTTRQLHFIENIDYGNGTGDGNGDGTGTGIGCAILDSPGLRELQLVDASHGVDQVFGDLVKLATQCRFRDCRHDGEPGCAIISALDAGEIDDERVARWEKLVEEDECNSNSMKEAAKMKESKQVWQKKNKPKGKKKTKKIKYSMMDE